MSKYSDPEINKAIGRFIKQTREHAGLSQIKLGGLLDVSYQCIQKYENGTTAITPTWAVKFAHALGVEFGWFWNACAIWIPYESQRRAA